MLRTLPALVEKREPFQHRAGHKRRSRKALPLCTDSSPSSSLPQCLKHLSSSRLALSFNVPSANGCHGNSCRSGQGGWLELLLCGMVHFLRKNDALSCGKVPSLQRAQADLHRIPPTADVITVVQRTAACLHYFEDMETFKGFCLRHRLKLSSNRLMKTVCNLPFSPAGMFSSMTVTRPLESLKSLRNSRKEPSIQEYTRSSQRMQNKILISIRKD